MTRPDILTTGGGGVFVDETVALGSLIEMTLQDATHRDKSTIKITKIIDIFFSVFSLL
jgi:hypothetical protein